MTNGKKEIKANQAKKKHNTLARSKMNTKRSGGNTYFPNYPF